MALEEFEKEQLTEKEKGYLRMRSIMDYGMGILWFGMGIFLLFIKKFSTDLSLRYDGPIIKLMAGIFLIYGLFRIYRGYKKNYFKS